MKVIFKNFGQRRNLKSVDRGLLTRFLRSFQEELQQQGLAIPGASLLDEEFNDRLAGILASPELLPGALNEALFAIDELSNREGQARLEQAVTKSNLALPGLENSTYADLALQVWFADPALLARVHNSQRLLRLSSFAHFGGRSAPSESELGLPPDAHGLSALTQALEPWFVRHRRGQNTTRVEMHQLEGDYWFLIRHGDTFARTPRVEAQRTEMIHYRPERDDVVVYSPEHDELRINARTKGERELYVRTFGQLIRGDEDYFSNRDTFTLEPLRQLGPEALVPIGISGLQKIVLREVEVARDETGRQAVIRMADDLFQDGALENGWAEAIPEGGRLSRAAMQLQFRDQIRPRFIEIRLPNVLKLGRHSELQAVHAWLAGRGFRNHPRETL